MSSSVDPAQLQSLLLLVEQVIDKLYIGFVLATVLYGITVLQGYTYFTTYKSDTIWLKLAVTCLLICDTLTTAFNGSALYEFLIGHYGDFAFLFQLSIPLGIRFSNLFLAITVCLTQGFYAYHIWSLSRSKWLFGGVAVLTFITFCFGMESTIRLFVNTDATALTHGKVLIVGGFVQGLGAVTDFVITAILCFILNKNRAGTDGTATLVDKLIIIVVQRGLLLSLMQTGFLVTWFVQPDQEFYLPFHEILGKLYVNSFLVTLNIRTYLRGVSENTPIIGTIQFRSKLSPRPKVTAYECRDMGMELGALSSRVPAQSATTWGGHVGNSFDRDDSVTKK